MEKFNYESYLNLEETPYVVEPTEGGKAYNIVVGSQTANFADPFDKAGAQILRDLKFQINPRATKNKLEVVDFGKWESFDKLNFIQQCKLQILKRQMPNFLNKYKEASPEQFVLFARKLLRPMRDSHCKNKYNEVKVDSFLTAIDMENME